MLPPVIRFYVSMMAGANKFLRIFYARVMKHLNSLQEVASPCSFLPPFARTAFSMRLFVHKTSYVFLLIFP